MRMKRNNRNNNCHDELLHTTYQFNSFCNDTIQLVMSKRTQLVLSVFVFSNLILISTIQFTAKKVTHQTHHRVLLDMDAATTSTTSGRRNTLVDGTTMTTTSSILMSSSGATTTLDMNELDINEINYMKERLRPRELTTTTTANQTKRLVPNQFLHLHHMKTAGTSIDQLIDCARKRLEVQYNTIVPYYNIHECDEDKYDICLGKTYGNDDRENKNIKETNQCQQLAKNAAIMSYCAPLKDLQNPFGWDKKIINDKQSGTLKTENDRGTTTIAPSNIDAITVFRHPVARVWSMYRFKVDDCYGCIPLKEVYQLMDDPQNQIDMEEWYGVDMCTEQLRNHMTRNVLLQQQVDTKKNSTVIAEFFANSNVNDIEKENIIVQQAIDSMKSFFTMVGITEEITTTVQMFQKVFPWLGEEYIVPTTTTTNNSNTTTTVPMNKKCHLVHANASPPNQCGKGHTHVPLGDVPPDQETIDLIVQHNRMDIQLYNAALKQFYIQKRALDL